VEEASLLRAAQRIAGGVAVEHDDFTLPRDRDQAPLQQQGLEFFRRGLDLPVARIGGLRARFQPVERAFAREGTAFVRTVALLSGHIGSAASRRQQWNRGATVRGR